MYELENLFTDNMKEYMTLYMFNKNEYICREEEQLQNMFFLVEGKAIEGSIHPDRVVVGTTSEAADRTRSAAGREVHTGAAACGASRAAALGSEPGVSLRARFRVRDIRSSGNLERDRNPARA